MQPMAPTPLHPRAARVRTASAVAGLVLGMAGAVSAATTPGYADASHVEAWDLRQHDCQVGGAPTHRYRERPPEDSLRYRTTPIVIGCATLASGRAVELVGYQLARDGRSWLCIDHFEPAVGVTWGCGSNLVFRGKAIDATSTSRMPGWRDLLAGALSPSVARVVVRSEIGGRLRRHPAAMLSVRDRELRGQIGIHKPFGRYLAEVPSGARAVTGEAFDARGRTVGLAFFEGFRGPVGQGRACYRRPRILRLRLLDPARFGRASRVRVVARHARGYISSIEATVSGRGRVRRNLARDPETRPGGRSAITFPVVFDRRGTVGVDVVADGVPSDKRCGAAPSPRPSAQKTLVVHVR